MVLLENADIFLSPGDNKQYISIDDIIMDNFDRGLSYFKSCLKKFIISPNPIQKKYITTYFKFYISHKFSYEMFKLEFLDISSINNLITHKSFYDMNLYILWSEKIYLYSINYLKSRENPELIWVLLEGLLLEHRFRYYIYITEMSNSAYKLETISLLGYLVKNNDNISDKVFRKILDIFITNNDYIDVSQKQPVNFFIKWIENIFNKNNSRNFQSQYIEMNSNSFMVNLVHFLLRVKKDFYSEDNNLDNKSFLFNVLKIIDITIVPLIFSYNYYTNRLKEINELDLPLNTNLRITEKKIINIIKQYNNILFNDKILFNDIIIFIEYIYGLIENQLDKYNYENSISYKIVEYLYATRKYNVLKKYSQFSKLFNYLKLNGRFHFIPFASLYLLSDLPCQDQLDWKSFFEIYSNTLHSDSLELNEKIHVLICFNKNRGLFKFKIDKLDNKQILNTCDHIIKIINQQFNIVNKNNTYYKKNKEFLKNNSLDLQNSLLLEISELLDIFNFIQFETSLLKLDLSSLYTIINQCIHYNLNIINNLYQLNNIISKGKYYYLSIILTHIIHIMDYFSTQDEFLNIFIENYDKKIFYTLLNQQKDNKLKTIIKTIENKIENNIQYPDEFCDPILNIEIRDPILLPDSKTILDKNTILHYLKDNNEDPFTRSPLTMNNVLVFNQESDTQTIIQAFLNKKQDWLEKTLKKKI